MLQAMLPPPSASLAAGARRLGLRAKGVSGLRIACAGDADRAEVTDARVLAAYDFAISVLRGCGAVVDPIKEAVDHRQQRRGSAHRHSYNPVEKLRLIDLLDEIYANPTVENKSHEFESDSRSKGVSFTTAVKWLKPHARREIKKAAAQDHAKRLLRIDTKSRRNGKYVPMEKELFRLFRLRRARARKTSSKCVQPAM
jgi:hypothetical protein